MSDQARAPQVLEALLRFDKAARDWGWAEDQATASEAAEAKAEYEKARAELHGIIAELVRGSK